MTSLHQQIRDVSTLQLKDEARGLCIPILDEIYVISRISPMQIMKHHFVLFYVLSEYSTTKHCTNADLSSCPQ